MFSLLNVIFLRYKEEFKLDKCFDVIVSNPPYVTTNEMKEMKKMY